MKKFLLATTALVAFSAGAQAADLGAPRMPIASAVVMPAFNWTGFYFGAQVGYGWGRNVRDVVGGGFTNAYNSNGLLGGVHVGYNWQGASPLVVGIVADIEAAGLSGNDANVGGTLDTARVNWQGSVRGRLGFAADRALFYVTGGLAFGGLNYTNNDGVLPVVSFSRTRTGWTLGAGVEYAFAPNWTAHAEYRYTDFGRTFSPGSPAALPNGTAAYSTLTTTHTVRLGVSYLFSTGPSAVVARY
ncbi:MAG: porin family protein [Phreatobacter sp.]|nr:porin family protein [Phreatobacter sp.]